MLLELLLQDLAIFASARAEFGPGLNCLTGETGAGKSVFLSALRLLQGSKADADLVRRGAERALVQARVRVPEDPRLSALLATLGIEPEDGELLLTREIAATGRSRARAGNVAVSLKDLANLARRLFDVHGQHAEQRLFAEADHAALLVALGGAQGTLLAYRTAWQGWREVLARARELRERAQESARQREFLAFQVGELEEARLVAGEEDEHEARLRVLGQAGQLAGWCAQIRDGLSDESALSKGLSPLLRTAQKLAAADPSLQGLSEALVQARSQLDEALALAEGYDVPEEADPEELDRLNARLARLQKLKSRHRTDLDGLIALRERLAGELRLADDGEAQAAELEREAGRLRGEVLALAADLEAAQRVAALELDRTVTERLQELGMPGAGFRTRFEALAEPGRDGAHTAVFELCPNPGEGWRDLAEVASGGEASRIMLAIESCLADADPVPLLVFDEVDAGLSGEVAHQVGGALARLAEGRQVVAITHLHQVAATAERHLSIAKRVRDGRTVSEVRPLGRDERVHELARMLGRPDDPVVRAHAVSLLEGRN